MLISSIIAVHGLGANPDHAWVRHKDTSAGLQKDVRWLTDLLPQTFREYRPSISARVFCFNYQSAWLGPRLSKNRLEDLATRLLDDIHHVRHKVRHVLQVLCYSVFIIVTAEWRVVNPPNHFYWSFLRWIGDRASSSPSKLGGR